MAQYDANCKYLLRDKNILAQIMIGCVHEFRDYTPEEAIKAIKSEPETEIRSVRPEAIAGISEDSSIPGEGRITFDIVFTAMTKELKFSKVYINLEAQRI